MKSGEFRKYAQEVLDWIVEYFNSVESYPVKSQVKPGEIFNKLPDAPPFEGENFENVLSDFNDIIIPGISHWQNPKFFAYFPTNTSYPSIIAEMLCAALDAQCMKWETSPAAAELEEKVMNWLRDSIGLPDNFTGVIQDTASTSTLAALITAREKYSGFEINKSGFKNHLKYRVYASVEAHSSVEKAVKICGIGSENLVKISVNDDFSINTKELENKIKSDIAGGYKPLFAVATFGTTGSVAVDSIKEVGLICRKYNLWFHIDAAYLGTALLLPEYLPLLDGIELADSFVFNPHKWMFTNFDCSAFFIKDTSSLINTFQMNPEYLKTKSDTMV
ncbi:MAG TPA: pyridoxal-dependent decarboxylase, partial [Ignavibacteria bacterium]|nr:pyridoxal-dependent decarboxylase [Ignavibacteria bacterium]